MFPIYCIFKGRPELKNGGSKNSRFIGKGSGAIETKREIEGVRAIRNPGRIHKKEKEKKNQTNIGTRS